MPPDAAATKVRRSTDARRRPATAARYGFLYAAIEMWGSETLHSIFLLTSSLLTTTACNKPGSGDAWGGADALPHRIHPVIVCAAAAAAASSRPRRRRNRQIVRPRDVLTARLRRRRRSTVNRLTGWFFPTLSLSLSFSLPTPVRRSFDVVRPPRIFLRRLRP
jgi:hypothetical protein